MLTTDSTTHLMHGNVLLLMVHCCSQHMQQRTTVVLLPLCHNCSSSGSSAVRYVCSSALKNMHADGQHPSKLKHRVRVSHSLSFTLPGVRLGNSYFVGGKQKPQHNNQWQPRKATRQSYSFLDKCACLKYGFEIMGIAGQPKTLLKKGNTARCSCYKGRKPLLVG